MVDKFKDFLTESKLTYEKALEVLGLSNSYTKDDVKKARNIAIKLAHPDKGGSLEQSKLVNTAYDLLKNTTGGTSYGAGNTYDREDTNAKYNAMEKQINADLIAKYTPDAFTKYFEDIFGKKFTHSLQMRENKYSGAHSYYAGFKSKFATEDDKIVFEFDVSVYLTDVVYKKSSLSNDPDISYTISVTAYGYANRKKQKMSQRDWKQMNNHSVLWDPKKSYTPAKMKKIANASGDVKMKRADFQLAMKNEVKATPWNDMMKIDLKDGQSILVWRIVFMRTPMWQLHRIGTVENRRFVNDENLSGGLPESESTIDTFLAIRKMTGAQALKLLDKEYKNYIGK